jgi:hypothetical protein
VGGSELELGRSEQRAQRSEHQRRVTVGQRVGWAVLALIVLAALVGLFGPGPLSQVSRRDASGLLQVEYERFARYAGDTSVELQVLPVPDQPGTALVWISSEYLSSMQVQQVQPEPDTWTGVGGGVVLAFPVSGPDPIDVVLQLRPDRIGTAPGAVGVPGQEPVEFRQLIYP